MPISERAQRHRDAGRSLAEQASTDFRRKHRCERSISYSIGLLAGWGAQEDQRVQSPFEEES